MSVGIGQCNNGAFKYPNYKNICNDKKDVTVKIENFCAFPGQGTLRSNYAKSMSSAGEWKVDDTYFPPCNFRPGAQPAAMDGPQQCCGGQCKIRGDSLYCKRTQFKGNPLTCCLKDFAKVTNGPTNNDVNIVGTAKYNACFSDDNQQNTCDPIYRDNNGPACRDLIGDYCAGVESPESEISTDWLNRWFKTPSSGGFTKGKTCVQVIMDNVFEDYNSAVKTALKFTGHCDKPLSPDFKIKTDGYYWAQDIIKKALEHYNRQFKIGALPGSVNSNPWEILFYEQLCCPLPGICQDGLNKICETSIVNDMKLNSLLAQWCGCHMANDQYEEYSKKFNIPKQCSSTCNRYGAIPLVGIDNIPIKCVQTICLIDDINISIVNTQIGGGIDFNQYCNNCQGGQCTCVISGNIIDIANSSIDGSVIPGLQSCGAVNCRQKNPTPGVGPEYITVPCDEKKYNPYDDYNNLVNQEKIQAKKKSWTLTIIITLISLIIIYLIIIFVHPKS
jgi:hypothetical protein